MKSCPQYKPWASKQHAEGPSYDNLFIAGITTPHRDITYHIHMKYWPAVEQMEGITILDKGKEWDGHTSEDIIRRLYKTIFETNK